MKRAKENTEHRLIIAGFGGQGILTAGKLLCTSCLFENKNVTYLPSYGSEVRGGTANCHVVISDREIYSPAVDLADTLMILNELSFVKFASNIKKDALLLYNRSMIDPKACDVKATCMLPIDATELATELGNKIVANIIMLGAYVARRKVCRLETIEESIKNLLSEKGKSGAIDLNIKALHKGAGLV